MDVTFTVAGNAYVVPERQAAILAENLRILATSDPDDVVLAAAGLKQDSDWAVEVLTLANSIEGMLVAETVQPLPLEGDSAAATEYVLRLMVGMDLSPAAGLRDALGSPVSVTPAVAPRPTPASREQRHLSRSELRELLLILFSLALLTVVAGNTWSGLWYVLAPVIAALLGLRVATTRTTGRFAWSLASIVWWGVLLVPASLLALLGGMLILALV